jgi:hypothetical protein
VLQLFNCPASPLGVGRTFADICGHLPCAFFAVTSKRNGRKPFARPPLGLSSW